MNLPVIRRTTLDNTLKLARLPFDSAIRLIPGDALGSKSAAKRAVDRVDALMRAVVGVPMPEASPVYEARERADVAPQAQPRPVQRGQVPRREHIRNPAKPPSQRAAAARRPAPFRVAPTSQPAAASPDSPSGPQTAQPSPAPPSLEEIAVRAYQLYESGMPGDADAHWRAAERELRSPQG
jgi:hypothetical protein